MRLEEVTGGWRWEPNDTLDEPIQSYERVYPTREEAEAKARLYDEHLAAFSPHVADQRSRERKLLDYWLLRDWHPGLAAQALEPVRSHDPRGRIDGHGVRVVTLAVARAAKRLGYEAWDQVRPENWADLTKAAIEELVRSPDAFC